MRINGVKGTVDMLGAGLVVCVLDRTDAEKADILEKRLCDLCGGRRMNEFEHYEWPAFPEDALLFTYDSWHYTVPHFNELSR